MIVDQTGWPIGEHRGLWFHTIGQRKGVGPGLVPGVVNLGPWYVADKDMENNVLVVTNDREAIASPSEVFRVRCHTHFYRRGLYFFFLFSLFHDLSAVLYVCFYTQWLFTHDKKMVARSTTLLGAVPKRGVSCSLCLNENVVRFVTAGCSAQSICLFVFTWICVCERVLHVFIMPCLCLCFLVCARACVRACVCLCTCGCRALRDFLVIPRTSSCPWRM